jgi:hypothetical protein
VIRTLADDTTRDIWNGVNSKAARRIPRELWPNVRRKLDQLDAVTTLDDLKVPPGNRLHPLGVTCEDRDFAVLLSVVCGFCASDAPTRLATIYRWRS